MANYVIGSMHRVEKESRGVVPGMDPPSEYQRDGQLHAVPMGGEVAVCGAEVEWVWDDESWPPGMAGPGQRCPDCLAALSSAE